MPSLAKPSRTNFLSSTTFFWLCSILRATVRVTQLEYRGRTFQSSPSPLQPLLEAAWMSLRTGKKQNATQHPAAPGHSSPAAQGTASFPNHWKPRSCHTAHISIVARHGLRTIKNGETEQSLVLQVMSRPSQGIKAFGSKPAHCPQPGIAMVLFKTTTFLASCQE